MFSRKILSGILSVVMLCSLYVPVSAVELTEAKSQDVLVTYGMNEGFTVTIPADFAIDNSKKATADVSASNVMISYGATLEVTIHGDDYVSSWELIDKAEASNQLTYTIGTTEGGSDIVDGSVVLSVGAGEAYDSTVTETMYFTVIDDLAKSGEYNDTLTFFVSVGGGTVNGVPVSPSIEKLETMYDFEYYGSVDNALSGTSDGSTSNTGAVGIYEDDEGNKNLVFLEDAAINNTIVLPANTNINFGGNTIVANTLPAIQVTGDAVIDGTLSGGKFVNDGGEGEMIVVDSGELTVNGGTYESTTSNAGTSSNPTTMFVTTGNSTLKLNGINISMTDSGNGVVVGVKTSAESTLELDNSNVTVTTGTSLENAAVHAVGPAVISNSSLIAEADYVANAAGDNYASNSRGIVAESDLELNDCYVWGAHSGVKASGNVIVNGGTYDGYGHGSFYLNGAGTTSYFYDATLNWAPMRDGLDSDTIAGTNGAGFYIGGASNIVAYFDNCDFNTIYGDEYTYKGDLMPYYGIVLRNSGGEANNAVYVSNSTFHSSTRYAYRIGQNGGTTLRIYNGVGNDYSGVSAIYNYSEKYVETSESYAK